MPETTDSGAHAWKKDHKGNAELNEALCVREGRTWFCGTLLHHLQAPGLDRVSSPKKRFFFRKGSWESCKFQELRETRRFPLPMS